MVNVQAFGEYLLSFHNSLTIDHRPPTTVFWSGCKELNLDHVRPRHGCEALHHTPLSMFFRPLATCFGGADGI